MSDPKITHFRRREAADYLETQHLVRCSTSTLAKLATNGGGPEYELSGRFPIYRRDALDRWAKSRKRGPFKSTSEAKAKSAEPAPVAA